MKVSIRKQKELRRFIEEFITNSHPLQKTKFGEATYMYRKGTCVLFVEIHGNYYTIQVGHAWDIHVTLDYPFTYDSRTDSWSANRGIRLPQDYYLLLLQKTRKQMNAYVPKILPNHGWRTLAYHIEEESEKKIDVAQVKQTSHIEHMKKTLENTMNALKKRIEHSLTSKRHAIEIEHYLEKLLQDLHDLEALLENTQHISGERLKALITEALDIIQVKYNQVVEEMGNIEEREIRRKLYLIQER